MIVSRKFQFGQHVEVCGAGIERHPTLSKLIGKTLVIDSVSFWQCRHFREDAYTVSYSVSPIEFEGFEHDENVTVGECNLQLAGSSLS